jgi:hypothetical protein
MCQDMSGLFNLTAVCGLSHSNVKHTYSQQSVSGLIHVSLIFMRIDQSKASDNCTVLVAVTSVTAVLFYMTINTRRLLTVNSINV